MSKSTSLTEIETRLVRLLNRLRGLRQYCEAVNEGRIAHEIEQGINALNEAHTMIIPQRREVAARMVEIAFENGWGVQICAEMNDRCRILEPSAGTGNIVRAIQTANQTDRALSCELHAVEVNPSLVDALKSLLGDDVRCADFLQCNGNLGKFDRILMNPPFENGSDIKHIKHALAFLNPGGRLVAICANGPRQREALLPLVESSGGTWEDLPAGSFKEQGTNVNTALIVIDN